MKAVLTFIIKLILILLIVLNHVACHTEKLLNSQKTRSSQLEKEDTRIQSKEDEVYQSSRMISLSDSSNQVYRLNIFPLDTFSFSLKDGFKGRASVIEVIGAGHRVKSFSGSARSTSEKQRELRYKQAIKMKKTKASASKVLEKSRGKGMFGIIGIGVLILVTWVCWRLFGKK